MKNMESLTFNEVFFVLDALFGFEVHSVWVTIAVMETQLWIAASHREKFRG